VRWGDRVTPLAKSDAELPPNDKTALQLVQELIERKAGGGRSDKGLFAARFAESQ
jgi:3-oxoacyl-[acyl-carrier-protein] synthase-3